MQRLLSQRQTFAIRKSRFFSRGEPFANGNYASLPKYFSRQQTLRDQKNRSFFSAATSLRDQK